MTAVVLRAEPEGGVAGLATTVLEALGDVGVGVLVLLETIFPPIPSEVILPFAGYLTQSGRLHLGWLIVWSTVGSTVGALLFYWLGAAVGLRRAIALLTRTHLISRDDLERGSAWFARHGAAAVLLGRLMPGVRSLISIPAGAARMHLGVFVVCTAIGSGIWNGALIGLGAALGTQRDLIDPYLGVLDYVVYGALAVGLVVLIVRRVRQARAMRRP
ncbi:DedA family protein [Amnibacterium endophyticum]|uniref:DedA family protein n=1 Tax=Amnibacterium endophyticum TaxID=2109337 RepID=A0ABW4LD65_9MICO